MNTPSRTDRAVAADLDVTAEFEIDRYGLFYEAGQGGRIDGAGKQTVGHGQDGSMVTAVANEGYHFTAWSDGLDAPKRTDRDITSDLNVKANFELNQYTLSYTAGENGTIEGDVDQSVKHGANGSPVVAVAEEGYHFVRWSDGLETPERH